jgi:hypothetical protein
MRGARMAGGRTGRRSELSQIDVLLYLVENRPGCSALVLSQAIYGDEASELRENWSALARLSAEPTEASVIRRLTIRSLYVGRSSPASATDHLRG